MCGFAGFVGEFQVPEGPASLLSSMAQAIAHRGPDGQGIYSATGVGLAHVRLSIVGVSDSHQPMATEDGNFVIAFNGEIFNFVELREELKSRGCRFRTGGDTEVLLKLYEQYGDECLARLNGDFAFAIWDSRRRRMLIARDRMGVRPLFYTEHRGSIFFASEAKSLLAMPGIEAELDPIALDQIFTLWAPIAPRTMFKGILELEPGTALTIEHGQARTRHYWMPTYPDASDLRPREEQAALEEELRSLLLDAIRLRMRADVPVGSYLSGGLDSSLIVAMAAGMAPQGLNTFSIGFNSAEHDESQYQRQVAEEFGTSHRSIACGSAEIADAFPAVVRCAERPVLRTAPAPLFLLSGLVRRSGMKVVLTGEGADELFAGYDIFREARVRRFCARQPASRLRPHLFRKLYPYLPSLKQQSAEYLASFFGVGGGDSGDPLFSHRPRMRSTAAAKIFYSDDLKEQLSSYDAAEDLASRLPAEFGRWHPLHQAQFLETRYLLPGYILSSQGDRMAMAHGVEGRFPFLDHRLVKFAARLHPETKLRGLREKHILRRIAKDVLPENIVHRPKQPYRAPDSSAFTAPEPAYVGKHLARSSVAKAGLFNPLAVERLHQKCRSRPFTGFRDNAAFIGILSTQLWLESFSRNTSAGRVDADRELTVAGDTLPA
ncbi:asparagine synthase (glutamine-hydrolyzing) [Pseudorhizobium tarimense]|uniref:asparagine synthase (glutamine-hydrolyzing) n=1 Tax=Pseudorhizobium tarimense TaxID=1079109 RepID=A0ABV2H8Z9_9HYPH|nr:asparagine synthase (glutamine-hydrolyzing) [Pseudorhizobium tarimense]MCJ8520118.1 asparagine synthase (glutamine-hydrolyzing) [Pseudorhizobium tarimense]